MCAFNFSAGPATLPRAVMQRAQEELLDYRGRGVSVMEMSHRGADFMEIAERTEACFRRIAGVGDDHAVLFLAGGASLQFSAVPLNLSRPGDGVDYVRTGAWSNKAIDEAARYARVRIAASTEADDYRTAPPFDAWDLDPASRYCHVTTNETIDGVQLGDIPADLAQAGPPLVADMSSEILSRPVDWSKFGIAYAGAQKNIGPAGLTVVVARRDLIGHARPETPSLLDYGKQAQANSMLNTPPTFAWYLAGLVFEWIEAEGGVAEMARRSQRRAAKLYDFLDADNFYRARALGASRSLMNVPFELADPSAGARSMESAGARSIESTEARFLEGAEARGLIGLKGHRSVGGMRASLYNALPEQAVDALIDYMQQFEAQHA